MSDIIIIVLDYILQQLQQTVSIKKSPDELFFYVKYADDMTAVANVWTEYCSLQSFSLKKTRNRDQYKDGIKSLTTT